MGAQMHGCTEKRKESACLAFELISYGVSLFSFVGGTFDRHDEIGQPIYFLKRVLMGVVTLQSTLSNNGTVTFSRALLCPETGRNI